MTRRLIKLAAALLVVVSASASTAPSLAAGPGGESAVDLSAFATTSSMNAAIASATTPTKVDVVPTTAPGPGKCRFSLVPSNLVASGGVPGTAGKCSRIVQCGTSTDYLIQIFDIGDGC